MNAEEIRETIAALAKSQGAYGRLLEALDAAPHVLEELAKEDFATPLDLILFIEG